MNVPQYVDISGWQPANIDWNAYRAWSASFDGISRVAIKSSEGTGFTDPHFRTYRTGALSAGVDVIIYYHYAKPSLNSPQAEADWQHQVVGSIRPQDVLMLDYEENVPQATAQWAFEWLARQEQNYGRLPTIYASDDYIRHRLQDSRLARFPLTLANWQFTPNERPACPPPWSKYTYLQYTDRATNIPGIAGAVDANIYLGMEELMIDLNNPTVARFFGGDAHTWRCTNGHTIHGEILTFYRSCGNSVLHGLDDLGLPLSEEIPIEKLDPVKYAHLAGKGITVQFYELGVTLFDPNDQVDHRPGGGRVKKAHLFNGGPGSETSFRLAQHM
jgi:GH25 family lysozyme M1 (1,4-beta-N-acetylmuramidase)